MRYFRLFKRFIKIKRMSFGLVYLQKKTTIRIMKYEIKIWRRYEIYNSLLKLFHRNHIKIHK